VRKKTLSVARFPLRRGGAQAERGRIFVVVLSEKWGESLFSPDRRFGRKKSAIHREKSSWEARQRIRKKNSFGKEELRKTN